MPKKPLVRVDVSWQTPKILFLGADTFLGSNFLRQLMGAQLEIWAVVNRLERTEEQKHLNVLSLAQDWLSQLPEKIDYVVDFLNLSESFELASKSGARLLTVWDEEQGKLALEKEKDNIDWRVVKTSFVFGPTDDLANLSFLNQVLLKAVLNEKINIPFSKLGQIFPLYLTDFSAFLEQALFSPVFKGEELVLVGEKVSWQKFLDYLEKKSQFTNGIRVEPEIFLPEVDDQEKRRLKEEFGWEPAMSWQQGVDKTLQYFFQKKEKGGLEAPAISSPLPARELVRPRIVEDLEGEKIGAEKKEGLEEEKEVVSGLDQDYWENGEGTEKTKKPKKKKKERNLKRVIIKANWEKEEPEKKELSLEEEIAVSVAEAAETKATRSKKIRLRRPNFSWSWPFLSFILLVLTYLFSPFLLGGFYFTLGNFRLYRGYQNTQLNRWTEAKSVTIKAQESLEKSLGYWQRSSNSKLLWLAQTSQKGAMVLSSAADLSSLALDLSRAIWEEEGEASELSEEIEIKQEVFARDLGLLEAQLASKVNFLPLGLNQRLVGWQEKIDQAQLVLEKSSRLLPDLSWWLGEDQPRRFLIVFQNNMELRPTGGFIGSLATLEVSGGKIVQFKVEDVYTVDGQLKGHVEPPLPIKDILGEGGWYLRDSNWSPDFPTSADKISWFYKKETGKEIDGVIALNLTSAQKILSQIGEIYLPDFEEKINADNLFAKAEFYSETNFFPGSSQKASFLTALTGQLLAVIQNTPDQVWQPLSLALWESLEEKELLISTTNEKANQALKTNNWDGRIKSVVIGRENSVGDFLFPVEANLGVNKANHFLRRSLSLLIEMNKKDKLDHLFQIYYENTSQTTEWPGGEYKNYLRLFVPLGTELNQVAIYDPLKGREQSLKIIPQEKIKQSEEKGKLVLGFLVTVPINSRRVVEASYSQKLKVDQDNWHYLLYLQKQSGLGNTPLTVLFSLPSGLKPLEINRTATLTDQGLVFEGQFTSDWPIAIEFSR